MKKYLAIGLAGSLLLAANAMATNRTTQYFSFGLGYTGISKPNKVIQQNILQPYTYGSTDATNVFGNLDWKSSRGRFAWDLGWGVLTRLCGPCYDECSWFNAVFDVHYRQMGNHDMKAVFEPTSYNLPASEAPDTLPAPTNYGNVLSADLKYYGLDFAAGILAAVGDCQRFVIRGQVGAMLVDTVTQLKYNAADYTRNFNTTFLPSLGEVTAQYSRQTSFDLLPEVRVGLGYRFTCNMWAEFNYTHVFGHKYQWLNEGNNYVGDSGNWNGYSQKWEHRAPRFDILEVTFNYKV